MRWMQKLFQTFSAASVEPDGIGFAGADDETKYVKRAIVSTHLFGLEVCNHDLGILEHSARVSLISAWLGARIGVSEADAYILQSAARLHEMGLLSIPVEILRTTGPLSAEELAAVRDHARVGAETARRMHHPRVPLLIENQYADYDHLRWTLSEGDLLLAGILRVADVIAAVTWPRPYQDPLSYQRRNDVLVGGAGTAFHPVAARFGAEFYWHDPFGLPGPADVRDRD